jgi:hypothetical protein
MAQARGKTNELGDTPPTSGVAFRRKADGEARLLRWLESRRPTDDEPPTQRGYQQVSARHVEGIEAVVVSLERLGFESEEIEAVLDDLWVAPAATPRATAAKVFLLARRILG